LSKSKIPKIIHQIWIGDKIMPGYCQAFCDEIKREHEKLGYEYKLWGNEAFDQYKDDIFLQSYLKNPKLYKWAYISDRLRLLLLRDYGGMHVDVDCKMIKSFDNIYEQLNSNITYFCGARQEARIDQYPLAVVGSSKNSRIVNVMLNSYKDVRWANGGAMLAAEMIANIDPDIAVFNYRRFYDMELTEDTIVLHDPHKLKSWWRTKEDMKNLWGGTAKSSLEALNKLN
tara:strand:- start:53 stop:736 length:684 start_codon:yes stop_codon:yes gene_type:complete